MGQRWIDLIPAINCWLSGKIGRAKYGKYGLLGLILMISEHKDWVSTWNENFIATVAKHDLNALATFKFY